MHFWTLRSQTETCCSKETGINNSEEEDLKVVEYLGGKVVYERHSCRQNSTVNSIELCQVDIECGHSGALKKELCYEFRQKIWGVLWSSARWALSRCKECIEELCCEFCITLPGGHSDSVQTSTRRELCWVLELEGRTRWRVFTGLLNTLKHSARGCLSEG